LSRAGRPTCIGIRSRNMPQQYAYVLEENLTVQADGGKARE
jgi:hypothetical protein